MNDPAERLPAADAVNEVRRFARAGVRIFGVDGFEIIPDGIIAHIDLILDLSTTDMSVSEAAREAEEFISANASENVIWEVCADVL